MVILIGLIIIPALYAWVNIIAFWDPYSDTKEVKVAVVNLDEGATSELTGDLRVGDQVVAQLKENDQLGWQFLGKDAAMTAVESGEVYATIVIPAEFSRDLLSIATGDFVEPKLEYYVNEKANAIAPKITDVGATTLETQINSTFVSTVAQKVAEALEGAGVSLGDRLVGARDESLTSLSEASEQVAGARAGLAEIEASLSSGETALADARSALQRIESTIPEVQAAIADAQAIVSDVQSGLIDFTNAVTHSFTAGSAQLSQISGKLNQRLSTLAAGANSANVEIATAIGDVEGVLKAAEQAVERLEALRDTVDPTDPLYDSLSEALERLRAHIDQDEAVLAQLTQLNGDVSNVVERVQASSDAINAAVGETAQAANAVGDVLLRTLPDINRSMNALSASAGGFSAALDAQKSLVAQAVGLLDELDTQLKEAGTASESLDSSLAGVERNLYDVYADVSALSSADLLDKVQALTGLDPDKIAKFMDSPVLVKEKIVFPVPTYGSAMAPLFTNLSLWIGAFVLVVLLKQEVDTEGIKNLTVRQAYLGRWMLVALINFFQAVLVSVGNIVIGVQMINPVAFVATSVFIGFVYMAVIYALAVSFGYIGKGIAVLLVIMQIPGASGIYPIQMMPEFFRALFPIFPFTYGIDALRETIGGFYQWDYWRFVGVLALFAVLAAVLGLFFRQRLGNFARLMNRKLGETNLFVSENVQVLGSRRRVTQLVQALTNREAFRAKVAERAEWMDRHHLSILRLTLLVGVSCTALLALFAWLVPDAKATVLALWGVLCLLVMAAVITLEYLKQTNHFAQQVEGLDTEQLKAKLAREERATHANAELGKLDAEV
ncbi:YhgE/Pip domain-containing protein [Microbacterium sp. H1-D42]|uniref:YhgE/Pip domain-containing protein n=1 Tax=Microbacterium sp. H1-D42 TaxID=2925844 RepID=UPI001F535330|nr:YhgE/Pip domain-containing protein [Microbacterium sp. H1-D42]UNK71320.1 YhgE/Pip domain-containing protein [Microbacterium sp. H1-D42]